MLQRSGDRRQDPNWSPLASKLFVWLVGAQLDECFTFLDQIFPLMKVLDLYCTDEHEFEGWFASEDDFIEQKKSGLLICPLCGDSTVNKRLSSPRLNLLSRGGESSSLQKDQNRDESLREVQDAWIEMSRHWIANTEDVGDHFAQEARKIHYGEVAERSIRGHATLKETESLIDEGIAVVPLAIPEAFKRSLQ